LKSSELEKEAIRTISLGMCAAGTALNSIKNNVIEEPDDMKIIDMVTNSLTNASKELYSFILQIDGIRKKGLDIPQEKIDTLHDLADSLGKTGYFLKIGNYLEASNNMNYFAREVNMFFTSIPELFESDDSRPISSAFLVSEIIDLMHDVTGKGEIIHTLRAILSVKKDEKMKAYISTITNPENDEIRKVLEIDDTDMKFVKNLEHEITNPDFVAFTTLFFSDPHNVTFALTSRALGGAIIKMASELILLGTAYLFLWGFFSCPNLCTTAGKKSGCIISATVTSGNNSPSSTTKLNTLMTILSFVPTPGVAPSSQAAKINMSKLTTHLGNIIQSQRPTVWIKIKYDQCDSRICWFTTRLKLTTNLESDWIQITTSPGGFTAAGFWPPIANWTPAILSDMNQAIVNELTSFCV